MATYDLSLLNPSEFEALANDMVEIMSGKMVERFKLGKDLGIDGRFFSPVDDGTCIIQSKHYCGSSINALLAHLKNSEYAKVMRLSPARYILFTSLSLNPNDKNKIMSCLNPYIKSTDDILGAENIDELILNNKKIEKKYYKLWIRSSSLLVKYLNQGIFESSEFEVKTMYKKAKYYAQTSRHNEAYAKLKKDHVVIITGDPGIGKTTLAEQLCLASIADGYECIVINEDVQEGFNVSDCESQHVFYFDDFLGSNYISALEKNEGSKIIRFINYVVKHDKRFILTSRANILDRAYQLSQLLYNSNVKEREYVINVSNYTDHDKALILYNMLWRSDIPKEYFEVFLDKKFFGKIIRHRNFNPRIIETITNNRFIQQEAGNLNCGEDFIRFVVDNLESPHKAWDNSFSFQLDDSSRALVMIVAISGGQIDEDRLINAYNYYIANNPISREGNVANDFSTVIVPLYRTFITKNVRKGMIATYSPFNPSVVDYIVRKLKFAPEIWANVERSINSVDSVNFLIKSHEADNRYITRVSDEILLNQRGDILAGSIYYIAKIGLHASDRVFKQVFVDGYYENYIDIVRSYRGTIHAQKDIILFFKRLLSISENIEFNKERLFYLYMLESYLDLEELREMSELLQNRDIYDDEIKYYFKKSILLHWEESVQDFAMNDIERYAEEGTYYDVDGEAVGRFNTFPDLLVNDILDETGTLYASISKADIKRLVDNIDLIDVYSDFIVRESRHFDEYVKDDMEEFDIHDLLAETFQLKYHE